jgi:hypothetical protein
MKTGVGEGLEHIKKECYICHEHVYLEDCFRCAGCGRVSCNKHAKWDDVALCNEFCETLLMGSDEEVWRPAK